MVDPSPKRLRISPMASPLTTPSLHIIPRSPQEKQDIISLFADRGLQKKQLEEEVESLQRQITCLEYKSGKAEAQISSLQVRDSDWHAAWDTVALSLCSGYDAGI